MTKNLHLQDHFFQNLQIIVESLSERDGCTDFTQIVGSGPSLTSCEHILLRYVPFWSKSTKS